MMQEGSASPAAFIGHVRGRPRDRRQPWHLDGPVAIFAGKPTTTMRPIENMYTYVSTAAQLPASRVPGAG